jgi:uncharacterized protein YkwD
MHLHTFVSKRLGIVLVAAIIGIATTACFPNVSSTGPSDQFQAGMYNALNYDRARNGLPGLAWSPKLANSAGYWSHQMCNMQSLVHQDLGALLNSPDYAGFYTLGENILVGPGNMSPTQMEAAWFASAPHRANILSTNFNIVGTGYYRCGDGRIWAAQEFGGI